MVGIGATPASGARSEPAGVRPTGVRSAEVGTTGAGSGGVLLIGIGNELRGDDGAGRRVADQVEALGLPGVSVRSVQQLVPELVEELAGPALVLFVDADPLARQVTVQPVPGPQVLGPQVLGPDLGPPPVGASAPAPAREPVSHHATPAGLFRLARLLGTEPPRGYVIHVPAPELGLGLRLSPAAETGVRVAIAAARRLIGNGA